MQNKKKMFGSNSHIYHGTTSLYNFYSTTP